MNVRRWKLWGGGLVGIVILGVLVYMSQTPSVSRDDVIALFSHVPLPFDRDGDMHFINVLEEGQRGDIVLAPFKEIIYERFTKSTHIVDIDGHIQVYPSEAEAVEHYQRRSSSPILINPEIIAIGEQGTVDHRYTRVLNRDYFIQRCHVMLTIHLNGPETIGIDQFEAEADHYVQELDQQLQTLCR